MLARFLTAAAVTLAIIASTPASATNYLIDTRQQHAFINFKVSHIGMAYIIGRFNRFSGDYSFERGNPAVARAEVTVDAASIDTNFTQRDNQLRGEQLLDAVKYPTIRFQSTNYQPSNRGDKLTGNLTIRDVTRSVVFEVTQIGEGEDPWGGYRSGFYAFTVVNAGEFGLPSWIGDVEIEINVEGVRQ